MKLKLIISKEQIFRSSSIELYLLKFKYIFYYNNIFFNNNNNDNDNDDIKIFLKNI
jgi:hypothetical protein